MKAYINLIRKSLAFNGDFNKAYYLFRLEHLIKYIINKIRKKNSISDSFWRDQSSASIKENINKCTKSIEKEQSTESYSANSEATLKDKRIYLMVNRFQYIGKDVEHDVGRTYIKTSQQVGINLKHFYLDNFQFETDSYTVESELKAFNPDYLILFINWYLRDEPDKEKRLSFLRHMKDELGFKLIIYIGDPHAYGLEKEVRSYVDIADKIISMSSWTPLFSFEEFQSKLRVMEYFTDDNLFFPELKKIDMSFSGANQPERVEIITFAAFVSSKLKLKTEFDLRSAETNWAVKTRKIIDDKTYIDVLKKSKTVINIGQKGTKENGKPIHIINGRVTEAIACGATLIQYKPKDDTTLTLDNYYTPWTEYLPFSSRKELKDILYLLKYEPDVISEIAHNGRQKYLECYSAAKSWEKMLKIPGGN
jgi:hypothetical protein